MPTGAKKNKTRRADAVFLEKWRTSPDRVMKKHCGSPGNTAPSDILDRTPKRETASKTQEKVNDFSI